MSLHCPGAALPGRRFLKNCFLSVAAFAFLFLLAACSGDDEVADTILVDVDRSPETSIVIPVGEPVVVGVSSALTGPAAPRGQEYRDAVVVAVEQWKIQNGPTSAAMKYQWSQKMTVAPRQTSPG